MGNVRQYDFVTTIETSTTPDPGTPSADNDAISKGFADDEYAKRDSYYDTVASITLVKAIATADRANDQLVFVGDLDVFYKFDSGSSATGDDDLVLVPNSGTGRWLKLAGGSASSSGASISTIERGEYINPYSAVYAHEKPVLNVTDSNKYIDLNEGAGNLVATVATGTYMMDTAENIDELCTAIETALDAAGGLTYTVTFSQTTRKFTIAAGSNFSMLWKTGTHGSDNADDHIGDLIGFTDSSNDTGADTFTADTAIDEQGTLEYELFWFGTDASYINKSKAYWGIDQSGGNKFSTASVQKQTPISGFTNTDLGTVYTLSAAIVIDSTNNKIDFNDGSDRSVTVTSGTYHAPYDTLCTDIKTVMDASASALTFTVTYDGDTDKFTIVGSSAFVFEWATGANTATRIGTILGYGSSDTSSQTSHTSTNPVNKKGKLGFNNNSLFTISSVNAGVAIDSTKIFPQRSTSETYLDWNGAPHEWLATPVEKDFSEEGILLYQHENSSGYGVRVFGEDGAGEDYHLQYKQGHGAAWLDASTLIQISDSVGALTENLGGSGLGHLFPKVFVDENNKAVFACPVWNNGDEEWRVYAYYSNDLNTWTKANGEGTDDAIVTSSTLDYFVQDLYIRQSKAVIVFQESTSSNSGISICNDSGSGYVNWTNTALSGTINFTYNRAIFARIQYFPAEVGVNQYRIVICGTSTDNARGQIAYTKGDGTSLAEISEANTFAAANAHLALTCSMDISGDGNAIMFTGQNTTSGVIYRCLTNAAYNGGTLTTNNFSSATINPNGTTAHDQLNGFTTGALSNVILNKNIRSITIGSKHYHLYNLNSGRELWLSYSIDSGASYSAIQLHNGSAAQLVFEQCMFYVFSINKIVVAYKFSDAEADNLTEGKIYAALIGLSSTGVPSLEIAAKQIDGGQAGTVFNGFLTGSVSTNAVNLSWEHYNGSTRDVLWSNKFI